MDAVGAGEFVPDLDPVDGAEQNPAESISNDVKGFSGLEKKTMFTAVNATQQIGDGTIEGEITDFGESVPGGELPATEYRHSDGSAGGDKESNQDGEGNLSEDGPGKLFHGGGFTWISNMNITRIRFCGIIPETTGIRVLNAILSRSGVSGSLRFALRSGLRTGNF